MDCMKFTILIGDDENNYLFVTEDEDEYIKTDKALEHLKKLVDVFMKAQSKLLDADELSNEENELLLEIKERYNLDGNIGELVYDYAEENNLRMVCIWNQVVVAI